MRYGGIRLCFGEGSGSVIDSQNVDQLSLSLVSASCGRLPTSIPANDLQGLYIALRLVSICLRIPFITCKRFCLYVRRRSTLSCAAQIRLMPTMRHRRISPMYIAAEKLYRSSKAHSGECEDDGLRNIMALYCSTHEYRDKGILRTPGPISLWRQSIILVRYRSSQ